MPLPALLLRERFVGFPRIKDDCGVRCARQLRWPTYPLKILSQFFFLIFLLFILPAFLPLLWSTGAKLLTSVIARGNVSTDLRLAYCNP